MSNVRFIDLHAETIAVAAAESRGSPRAELYACAQRDSRKGAANLREINASEIRSYRNLLKAPLIPDDHPLS